ncbi:hypothetical protein ACEWY4_019120 [Coilia grayii]|uniref:Transposase n=1 Tax=Coilia grayii TaxID=363190 RepID=A0ABD1JHH0_9TELE
MEEETPETTTASTSSTTTNEGEPQSDEHPWPYLSAMFSYSDVKDSSYRMKCLLCLPKNVEILSYRNSPSNLKKHIEVKLDKVKLQLKYCKPLVDALLSGIQNRFGHMFMDAELVAAAILLPKFRMTWTKDDATIKMGIDYIKQHIEDPSMQPGEVTRSSSDEDDFFSSLQASKTQDGVKQFDAYLSCSADHMDLLKSFPSVCKLSVKLNTPLPASAACERLFSIAGLVFSPRRVRLNSRLFESQLLLKMNKKFYSFK